MVSATRGKLLLSKWLRALNKWQEGGDCTGNVSATNDAKKLKA